MKKILITLFCAVVLISSVCTGYCEPKWVTNDKLNGSFIVDSVKCGKDTMQYCAARFYFYGLWDALLSAQDGQKIIELYGAKPVKEDIFEAIYRYYQSNPDKQTKSVVQVLLEGVK